MCPCTVAAPQSAGPSAAANPAVCPDCILKSLSQMEPEAQALLLMANPALMFDQIALSQYLLAEMQPQIHKQQQQLLAQQQHLQQLQPQQLQAAAGNREFLRRNFVELEFWICAIFLP
ncbi:unnamed protein product, partial [Mesorhabditis spiculigera]